MKNNHFHQDVFIGIVCLAFCLFVYSIVHELPEGAATMPLLLDALLAFFAVLIIMSGLRKSKMPDEAGKGGLSYDALKIPLITWALVAVYFGLFWAVGYFIATGIMLIVFARFMKQTSWPVIIGIDVVYLLIMYFIFARMLDVNVDNFGLLGSLF